MTDFEKEEHGQLAVLRTAAATVVSPERSKQRVLEESVDAVVEQIQQRTAMRAKNKETVESHSRRRGTWTGCSCGSVEEYERDSDCASCRHDR